MATISPGVHTFQEVFDAAGFDLRTEALASYDSSGSHVDYRRVKVGKLGFDDPSDTFVVPDTTNLVEITLDDEVVATLDVA